MEEKKWYENMDNRWNAIGELVYRYGDDEMKIAWALCRGDAAEWRLKYGRSED